MVALIIKLRSYSSIIPAEAGWSCCPDALQVLMSRHVGARARAREASGPDRALISIN